MADDYTDPTSNPRGGTIRDLVPLHHRGARTLTPETEVALLHRGWTPIDDKFDGVDYELLPGRQMIAYGAAMHFRARAVVPGTRNPEIKKQESFLVIMDEAGPDRREHWRMFTDEERARIEGKVEAIARDELSMASDRDVKLVSTGRIAATMPGAGAGGGRMRPDLQGDPRPGMPGLNEVLSPPEHNEAQAEMRQSTYDQQAELQQAAAERRRFVGA